MLQNFFKTAFRNMTRNKSFAVINFVGLTCGLALALLILTYVREEMRFDTFHEKADRIYRLNYFVHNGLKLASTPPPIAPLMTEYFPEVEVAARMYNRSVSVSRLGTSDAYEENDVYFADSTIVDIFSFDFVRGDAKQALAEPFGLVLTEEMATKYFGRDDPMGAELIFSGKHAFTVTGVVRSFPYASHIRFNMLVPYDNMYDMELDAAAKVMRENLETNFVISHSYTYALLKPGADYHRVNDGMQSFLEKYANPSLLIGQRFELAPVRNIHLHSEQQLEPVPSNSMTNIYVFMGIGVLTLIIACINYINLATAQSFTRIKEISIRKIMGSQNRQLIFQFLAESFIFCGIAFLLSFGALYLMLPFLNTLLGSDLKFSEVVDRETLLISVILLVVVTLVAGGYPSLFVTRFTSVRSMRGGGPSSFDSGNLLRKALVVFQLLITCILLSGYLMIFKQLRYVSSRPLGFHKEQMITVPLFSQNMNSIFGSADDAFQSKLSVLRERVEQQAGVISTAISSYAPGTGIVFRGTTPEGFSDSDHIIAANLSVDYDFFDTYGLTLVAGRLFSRENGADSESSFIVNETAVREFNWGTAAGALGKTIDREGKKGTVIGVVRDFNFTELTTAISALVIELWPSQYQVMSVKFEAGRQEEVLNAIRSFWTDTFPEKTFEFNFLDEQLTDQYASFHQFGEIIRGFTIVAILISCLGVYGLMLFMMQRKVKEIGVRKVLGATVGNILGLIYREFVLLLMMAFLLAIPFSYYLINQWLDRFIYHTEVDVFTYLLSFAGVLLVVWVTVSLKAVRASLANPVDALRSE